jgi:hypothetical protein
METLPYDMISLIDRFYNPYRNYYSKTVIYYFNNKKNYSAVMRELKRHNLYNASGDVIMFQVESILGV